MGSARTRGVVALAVAGFLFFWTVVVGAWAAYQIAVGAPSVMLSLVLLLLVIGDVIAWRKWRALHPPG